jgi:glucosamine--fructose-6-phosphate aminotransferase (isomerizing)
MLAEIREQPAAIRRLLEREDALHEIAVRLVSSPPPVVRMVAHGTSDNAATYGVYAFGLLPGWTALRDSISLTVYYDAEIDIAGQPVIGLSQSGETPDVVRYVERARSRGAFTIAITNDETSTLAKVAECVIPLEAGPERAVAATKTYVNSLVALALLAGHAAGRGAEIADGLRATADLVERAIDELEPIVARMAPSFAILGRMFVVGRGTELATAREIALKLQETCRVAADALSATDLSHGPVAAVDALFPVWAIATEDANLPAVVESARRAHEAGATLIASGSAANRIDGASFELPTPAAPSTLLAPLVSVVPGQLFARALALAKGYDPDSPQHLSKVTRVL